MQRRKLPPVQVRFYIPAFVLLSFVNIQSAFSQHNKDSVQHSHKQDNGLQLILPRLDTLLHLQSWISNSHLEYKIVYNKDFKLLLAPNEINNLSFGFNYRYVDLGLSISPQFLNAGQDEEQKGKIKTIQPRNRFQYSQVQAEH